MILTLLFLLSNAQAQFGHPQGMPRPIGYFVLTQTTYTGALGGLTGAASACVSELTTYDWRGKANATLNTPLSASRVRAFLCDATVCNNGAPNTTYGFAVAGSPSAGGALFTTDGSGTGPGDTLAWSTADRFNTVAVIWSGRSSSGSSTQWPTAPNVDTCTGWTTSILVSGTGGSTVAANGARWSNTSYLCGSSFRIICIVDP